MMVARQYNPAFAQTFKNGIKTVFFGNVFCVITQDAQPARKAAEHEIRYKPWLFAVTFHNCISTILYLRVPRPSSSAQAS